MAKELAGREAVRLRHKVRELRDQLERQAVGDDVDRHRLAQQSALPRGYA
jgi:hypothetical protein